MLQKGKANSVLASVLPFFGAGVILPFLPILFLGRTIRPGKGECQQRQQDGLQRRQNGPQWWQSELPKNGNGNATIVKSTMPILPFARP